MTQYKVIEKFKDLSDDHIYEVGDIFPYDGRRVSKKRIEELSTDKNKREIALIEKVEKEVVEEE